MPKTNNSEKLEQDTINLAESIVDTPEGTISSMKTLKLANGWKKIHKALREKIKGYTTEILDTDIQGEELSRLRDRRDLVIWFSNLPDILIEYNSQHRNSEDDGKEFDPDPFDKATPKQ